MSTVPDAPPPTETELSGQLMYADGTPAAGVPFEIRTDAQSIAGTTGADGRFEVTVTGPVSALELRTLDGFGVGLGDQRQGMGAPTVSVPVHAGRLETAYLLAVPRAMVLVCVPSSPTAEVRQAIAALDLVGTHEPGQLLTTVAPQDLARLRALAVEVLVLHVDANAYAATTGEMTDAEREQYIDTRITDARTELDRLPH